MADSAAMVGRHGVLDERGGDQLRTEDGSGEFLQTIPSGNRAGCSQSMINRSIPAGDFSEISESTKLYQAYIHFDFDNTLRLENSVVPYQLTTGTSVAACEVSGIVALLLERNRKLTPRASHRPEPKLWSRSPVPSRFALEVRMPRMSAGAPASRPAPERALCRPRRADMPELAVRAPRGC